MRDSLALLFVAAVVLPAAQVMSGTVSRGGIVLFYETRLEPERNGITKIGGGTLTENDVIKRHLCDFIEKRCFGYDLRIERADGGRYRLQFSPLTMTPQQMEKIFPKVVGWQISSQMPRTPATQDVSDGDTLALDLFLNPSTGQKLVDYLKVHAEGQASTASGTAVDFSVDEGWLQINAPRLTINGKAVEGGARFGVSGSPIWMYVNGYGRFVFTLAPRIDLGFEKAGEIRGSTMKWRLAGDEFLLETDKRIASGGKVYNLYVFRDANYLPKGEESKAPLLLGAGGSIESLVRR